ncbi:ABC transporter ATP-binding protein [Roseibium aestuarii]|uniref:ABC transporter ATP-binding protein n=1 Tax=Roseibium aestuarii TaxID=2600299 RepID=A0ABW4JSI4_9HYPH|nr:ABC transporter ATP-binding protein [Roseibium aestuarii]
MKALTPDTTASAALQETGTGLELRNITHAYGPVTSLDDVSLSVAPGEVLCLLGHSGCGKTTLMRVAAGVECQTSGEVRINGRIVAGEGGFVPPEKRGVGLMFQDYALFPHMTILKNVLFGLKHLGRAEAREQACAALARVGLLDHAEDYPHALSGGEQQRVALARALAPRPGILLMDEPFSGLDKRLRDKVREETLAILRESRASCIVVTHDPEEAMRMGDRIALMRKGRLVQVGAPRDFFENPADLAAARFFSELNELPGTVVEGGVDTPIGLFRRDIYFGSTLEGLGLGAPVRVVIRPSGLMLGRKSGQDRFMEITREIGQNLGQATVMATRFVGEMDILTLAVEGYDHPFHARLAPGLGFRSTETVSLRPLPRETLVFPEV